jgi:iron-sulfur cluster repair protein YtfE (RIC family)
MSQTTVQTLLEADHREIDAAFDKAVAGDRSALATFKQRLEMHMKIEEEILFPALAGTPLATPCRVMAKEHDLLRELLADDDLQALPTCLGSHNNKEERVIYPACTGPAFEATVSAIERALAKNPR